MGSCSGNSSTCTKVQSSCSEEELQVVMDERKNKRKLSNRESARRCRMRKQNHLDEMMRQVSKLTMENREILMSVNITTQHYMNIEAENNILRVQKVELNQRLESLNSIINLVNKDCYVTSAESFMNPINMLYFNQPIMASMDIFQC